MANTRVINLILRAAEVCGWAGSGCDGWRVLGHVSLTRRRFHFVVAFRVAPVVSQDDPMAFV